eukprot:8391116-Lingulodinium_polyedra.AAC.1
MLAKTNETNDAGDSGRNSSAQQTGDVHNRKSYHGLMGPTELVNEKLKMPTKTNETNVINR